MWECSARTGARCWSAVCCGSPSMGRIRPLCSLLAHMMSILADWRPTPASSTHPVPAAPGRRNAPPRPMGYGCAPARPSACVEGKCIHDSGEPEIACISHALIASYSSYLYTFRCLLTSSVILFNAAGLPDPSRRSAPALG